MLDYAPAQVASPMQGGMPPMSLPQMGTGMTDLPPEPSEQVKTLVKMWQGRIIRRREQLKPDFERMRENMEFVWGLQWPHQTTIATDRYVANITQRLIAQKVATLYAKNPTTVSEPRKRLDYKLWDGKLESLEQFAMQAAQYLEAGIPLPPEMQMFAMDIEAGQMQKELVKKVGATLEKLDTYFTDNQKPEYKQQLKQAVRRAAICGVAYARPVFCSDGDPNYITLSTTDQPSTMQAMEKSVQEMLSRDGGGDVMDPDSVQNAQLSQMMQAVQGGYGEDPFQYPQRIEHDFLPATSVIPDECCRSLVDWVNAEWIAIEYTLKASKVSAIFGKQVRTGSGEGSATEVDPLNPAHDVQPDPNRDSQGTPRDPSVRVWEVFDKLTKTRFFICEGFLDFLLAPEPPRPAVMGFFPVFPLVFNEVEVEPGTRASLFPCSDVQSVKSAQLEWNRTRDALRDQRVANNPVWLTRDGNMTPEDEDNIANGIPNSVVKLKGVGPETDLNTIFVRRPAADIDDKMYETAPLEQDMMMGGGMQQANLGPAQPNVTATVGTIAEQSRMDASASNVDDLDGFLSRLAQARGEMYLQAMDPQIVEDIVGPGAVFPSSPETRSYYLKQVYLQIKAASSGRPNKAVDVANMRDLTPLLLQAGANPVAVIKKIMETLDANADVQDFFPLNMDALLGSMAQPGAEGQPAGAGQPPDQLTNPDSGIQSLPPRPSPALAGSSDATRPQP